jgi:hypothetical protein
MYKLEFKHFMLYLWGEKVCICGHAEGLSPEKRLGPQIANPQSVTIAEGPQI